VARRARASSLTGRARSPCTGKSTTGDSDSSPPTRSSRAETREDRGAGRADLPPHGCSLLLARTSRTLLWPPQAEAGAALLPRRAASRVVRAPASVRGGREIPRESSPRLRSASPPLPGASQVTPRASQVSTRAARASTSAAPTSAWSRPRLRTAASRIRGAPVLGQSGRARRTPRGAADLARRSPTELVLSLIRSSRSGFLVAPPSAQRAPPRPFLERLHFKTTAAVPARRAALRMEGAQRSTPSAARRAPRAAPPASFASLPTSRASPGAHADALAPLDADVM